MCPCSRILIFCASCKQCALAIYQLNLQLITMSKCNYIQMCTDENGTPIHTYVHASNSTDSQQYIILKDTCWKRTHHKASIYWYKYPNR